MANINGQNSKARVFNLPCTLTQEQWHSLVIVDFKGLSAIYNVEFLENPAFIGHVIPLSWGHGGTYIGNIFPLTEFENRRLGNRNPLKYINSTILEFLANENDLTLEEYKSFVNWCEKNRRSKKECRMYNGTYNSLEVWKSFQN